MSVGELVVEGSHERAVARRSTGTVLAFAAVTVALAPVAYMSMFSVFQAYDDEGYFLITLRDYTAGHPLFTQALPIYGPFFYEVMGGVYKVLGLEPSPDAGRFMTVVVWLIAALLGGVLAYRLTRNLWLSIGALLVTFRVLADFVNEPMQPAGITSLLLMSLMIAATFKSSRPRANAAVIGAIVGALLLTKVNVGVFAAIAVVFAWAANLPERWRRLGLPLMAMLVVALPLVLMSSLLGREWVLELAIVMALTAGALGVVTVWSRLEPGLALSAGWLAIGGTVVVLVCLGVAAAGGTDLGLWWSKTVVLASRFPQIFIWPVTVSPGYVLWAAVSLAGAFAFCVRYARASAPSTTGLLRVWAGFFMWLSVIVLPAFLLALPLAWMAAQAPRDDVDNPTGSHPRLLLSALAVVGSLQIYPVAGTQLSLAAIGLLPLGAISLSDGIRQLRRAEKTSAGVARLANGFAPSIFAISVAAFALFGVITATEFAGLKPLRLPGATSVRMSAQKSDELRSLVAAIDQNCGSFITFPGMNSFYFWTAKAPPVELTSEVWWLVLDSSEQETLVDQLQRQPRLCLVKNQRVIDFWAEGRDVPTRPLVEFINADFVAAGSYGDYELWVRRAS